VANKVYEYQTDKEEFYLLRSITENAPSFNSVGQPTLIHLEDDTDIVRIYANEDVYIEFGTSPFATRFSPIIRAGSKIHFRVERGYKISALGVSTNGFVHVAEKADVSDTYFTPTSEEIVVHIGGIFIFKTLTYVEVPEVSEFYITAETSTFLSTEDGRFILSENAN